LDEDALPELDEEELDPDEEELDPDEAALLVAAVPPAVTV
jgi:hypothetical protein